MTDRRPNWFKMRSGVHAVLDAVGEHEATGGATVMALALAIWAKSHDRTDEQVLNVVREALALAKEAA